MQAAGVAAGATLIPDLAGASVTWPQLGALPRFAKPRHLDVTDIRELTPETQTLFTTLQGIVNRVQPRIYYQLQQGPSDATWLSTMRLPTTRYADPWKLFDRYVDAARGLVVYDPDVSDTVNLATTIAGVRNAVVVDPALAEKLTAAPYRLPILEDLRGRFSAKLEVYRWALDHLWDKVSHNLFTGIAGTNSAAVPGVEWTTLAEETEPIRDESNKDTYTIDLSGQLGGEAVYVRFSDAFTNDGWGPSVQQVTVIADGETIADFQPTTAGEEPFVYDLDGSSIADGGWRFADGGNSFIYRFAPPAATTTLTMQVLMWNQYVVDATDTAPTMQVPFPIFRDYIVATKSLCVWLDPYVEEEAALFTEIASRFAPTVPYLGWFVGGHESHGVTLLARESVPVHAADFYTNGTVHSGTRARIRTTQPAVPTPPLRSKVYVTLTMSEGDNLQYCEHALRSLWDDPKRGAVPINWSINPMLIDAGQTMLSYYQRTQTSNDLLVVGPSGAGYTYPDRWPSVAPFTKLTGSYMQRTGMDIVYALNRENDTNLPLTESTAQSYLDNTAIDGMLYNWISDSEISWPAGLPVVTQVGIGSVDDGHNALGTAVQDWDGNSPLFVGIGVLAWNMGPAQVTELVNGLDDRFVVVRADVFFDLLRASRG